MIPWPLSYDSHELIEFTGALEGLKDLKGEMRLSQEAFELWKQLARDNRRQIEAVSGIDPASETYGSVLASSPAKTLKLSMIFEVCRWLKGQDEELQLIQADTLELAPGTRLTALRPTGISTEPRTARRSNTRRIS
jgi:predicted HAD superfamily phosphohydrolase